MGEWQYADQILHVHLTTRTAEVEPTSLELKRDFVGGAGFVARLLAVAGAIPGDEPVVALAAGPLSDGTAGRLAMGAAPGPAGGSPNLSSLGGKMAAALKQAGYDALVLRGQLDEPGCLVLEHDSVRLIPAADVWGLEVPDAEAALARLAGPGYTAMLIGPAGESRDPAATVAHDGHFAGGSGVGAALGAQQLKAILLREPDGIPSRCAGCTLACPVKQAPEALSANRLGLDLLAATGRQRRRRGSPGMADLLGTCQRLWRDRPGELLRSALSSTLSLLNAAV